MQLADDVADVGLFAVLLQALVDDIDRIVFLPVRVDALDVDAGLELLEDLPAHHLEALAGLVVLVGRFLGRQDGGVAVKTGLLDDVVQRRAPLGQECANERDGLGQVGQQFFLGFRRIGVAALAAMPAVALASKGRQRLAQVLEDAAVIDDQAVVLALVAPGWRGRWPASACGP